jgi:hypothetical protein
MPHPRSITIEGYTPEEVLALPPETLSAFIVTGEPLILQIGSARLLVEFRQTASRLTVELAHIDGGGEGVLRMFSLLVTRYAEARQLSDVEWIVHAVACAQPNLKLRRVLERRGFALRDVVGIGKAYYFLDVLIPRTSAET